MRWRQLLARLLVGDRAFHLSPAADRRYIFVNGFTVISAAVVCAFTVVHLILGMHGIALYQSLIVFVAVANVVYLRRGGRLEIAEHVLLGLGLALLTGMLYAAIEQTGAFWFAIFPAGAFFIRGLRGGAIWTGALFAALMGVFLLQLTDILSSRLSLISLLVLAASLAVSSAIIALYEYHRSDAERRLEERNREYRQINAELRREIEERRQAEQALRETERQMRFLAHHDPLTKLPNRALVYDRLEMALATARRSQKRLAVLFLDLDKFKPINDRYGHIIGDRVLQAVAERLKEHLRSADTVGRVGGDEFVVVLSEVKDRRATADVAAALVDLIRIPYRVGEISCELDVSIGMSCYPEDGDDADALINAADTAMYVDKHREA